MYQIIKHRPSEAPWNKGKIVGQKLPLKLHEIWAIRTRLQIEEQVRDLALFNLAVDSKLRASDLVKLRVSDVATSGHEARIIPAKAVAPFRQGHKTDSNDALAVAAAARRPKIKEAPMKTVEQQGLQAVHRSRELLIQGCTALSNHVRSLLMEFGIVIARGFASLLRAVPEILEDGENELPDLYRPTLQRMFTRLLELREDIEAMTGEVECLAKAHPICSKLMALEGIGPIGALLLYATMGSGAAFSSGREFAAYLGLAPKQYSSGGKTTIVGLSRKIGNSRLRSVLILGARAYVYKLKEPKSSQDKWLKAIIEHNGESRAAIALANKNVRTAWAMVTQGTEYQRRPQLEMAA